MDKTLEIELAEIRPKDLATAVKFFRSSSFHTISPFDIESITVVKDGSPEQLKWVWNMPF